MRSSIIALFFVLCCATAVAAGGPAQLMGSVEAVYHEGLVTFQVDHADAVSISIKVYDLETDALIYDSGPRARTQVSWPAGHDVVGSFRYVVTAWNEQGEVVVSQAAVTKNLTPISDIRFDTIPGNTKLLGPNEVIVDTDLQVGDVNQGVRLDRSYISFGGAINTYEEDGSTRTIRLEPDINGAGGYITVEGPGGSIALEGNSAGQTRLFVGGTSSFTVASGSTGDASVVMPASSVASGEMANEPGVAADFWTTSQDLTPTSDSVAVRTINAPTAGYVLATAFVDSFLAHTAGITSQYSCSISDTLNTQYFDGLAMAQISSGAGTGGYRLPISLTRIFSVTAGSHQFHLVCAEFTGSNVTIHDRHLDLLFVPTAYGTVSTESLKQGSDYRSNESEEGWADPDAKNASFTSSMNQAEIDAERAESIAFNLARIQAELDAIRAENEALIAAGDDNQP